MVLNDDDVDVNDTCTSSNLLSLSSLLSLLSMMNGNNDVDE